MKSLLIFPPAWNPCSPYLALPLLKSYLHSQGYEVSIKDINVEFYDYIFTKDFLSQCLQKDYPTYTTKVTQNTIEMFKGCIEEIDFAKTTMRSHNYLNADVRKHVDAILTNALYIINNTTEGLKITFNGIELYHNRNSSASVYKACYDEIHNPYIGFYRKEVIPKLQEENNELIGISVTTHTQLISALTLCRVIKETCPLVKHIFLGGNYITRSAEQICSCGLFDDNFFDSIVLYDGEVPCSELIEALLHHKGLSAVHNIMYIKDGEIIRTPFLKNSIVNTCTPDFTGFPLAKYFVPDLICPIYTSRCCYNKCAFCTIPHATSGNYRALPIESVVENIKLLNKNYNAHFFQIVDETFDVKRMLQFAEAIIKSKLNIYWNCETRFSNDLTRENCETIYKSGCRQIQFGLESYNQRVLDKMLKNINIEWIDKSVTNCMATGISVHMFFMVGFPTETRQEALRTFEYTGRKLTESQIKYNVISSRGYGTFGLDVGSHVWLHPEEFGVTIKKNGPENDLRLNLNYEVSSGLSENESNELVNVQKMHDGFDTLSIEEFELPNMDFVPEIHMVIKATLLPGVDKTALKKMLSIDHLAELLINHKIMIPSYVTFSKINKNIVLYNKLVNRAYVLPQDCLKNDFLLSTFNASDIFDITNKKILHYLASMVYFGFVSIEGIKDSYIDAWESLKLIKSHDLWSYYNKDLEQWIVLNRISRSIIAVNKLSFKILGLFEEPISFLEVCAILKKNSITLSEKRLSELINYYLEHNILYALD